MPGTFTGRTTAFGGRQGAPWWIIIIALAGAAVIVAAWLKWWRPKSAAEKPQGTPQEAVISGPILSNGQARTEDELEGVRLFKAGRVDDAIRWFNDYLSAGVKVPRADAALYYTGLAWLKKGNAQQMSGAWKRLGEEFPTSEYTGKMLLETARLTPDKVERERALYLAWKGFGHTAEGKRAAIEWADPAYDAYAGTSPDYTKWEDLWEAYSLALSIAEGEKKAEVMKRAERLGGYLILNPAATPKGTLRTKANPGDSLSVIAHRHGIMLETLIRENGLKSDVVQPGQEFKVYPVTAKMVIDRARYTLDLYINGKFFKQYKVGIGKGDLTPAGRFEVKNKVRMPTWFKGNERIEYGDPRNILGTRWMGFGRSGPGKGLGIHGTTEPGTVPGSVSQGCIRMLNEDVEEVYDLTPIGTEVTIL
jgi:lipoprotein-anchoring transpeptidase ErfK/SrfK